MLAEFLEKIAGYVRAGSAIECVTSKDIPELVFVRQGAVHSEHEVPPARRAHSVHGYADILSVCSDQMAVSPEIFHDHTGIVVHLERGDRRDLVRMPLEQSHRFKVLRDLQTKDPMTQQEAIRLLRFGLHGTGVDSVIAALRRMDTTRKSDGRSLVEHGRESLGRSVEAAVQNADQIPEAFQVHTPVFINPGLAELTMVTIWCGVLLDLASTPVRIEIKPLADEVSNAFIRAQEAIGAALARDLPSKPIFHGKP